MTASHGATDGADPTGRFAHDTAVEPEGDGRYRAHVRAGWEVIDGAAPNGGYLLAIAARAMRAPLPDHPDPVTVTAHFLRPAHVGEVTVDVEVIRRGRRHATVTGTVHQDGAELLRLIGAFGDLSRADGPTHDLRTPPHLPPREDCVAFTDRLEAEAAAGGATPAPVVSRFDHRIPAERLGWTRGEASGQGEIGGYLAWRDGVAMDTLGLLVVADCYPPAVFDLGAGAIGWTPTIELTVQVRTRPSPGDLVTRFATRSLTGGYLEEDGEVWDADGNLVVLSRQLALAARPRT